MSPFALFGAGEAEVVAQGAACVGGAHQATTAQLRYDVVGELLEGGGHMGGLDHEAVGRARVEPLLHGVGDVRGRADHVALGAGPVPAADLAHAELLALGELDHLAVVALDSHFLQGRQRAVEVVAGEVHVDVVGQPRQPGLRMHELGERLVLGQRVLEVGAYDRRRGRKHLELPGVPTVRRGTGLDVGVEGDGRLQRLVAAEDDIRPAGREVPAGREAPAWMITG